MGKEGTVLCILAELTASDDVRHTGDGGEEVVRTRQAGVALQPAGVGGEHGPGEGEGEQEEESSHPVSSAHGLQLIVLTSCSLAYL